MNVSKLDHSNLNDSGSSQLKKTPEKCPKVSKCVQNWGKFLHKFLHIFLGFARIMAKIGFYLDVRRQKKDGNFPLRLRISHQYKLHFIPLPFDLPSENWDDKVGKVIAITPRLQLLQVRLDKIISQCKEIILEYELQERDYTCDDLRDEILSRVMLQPRPIEKKPRNSVIDVYEKFASFKTGKTLESYEYTLAALKIFLGRKAKYFGFDDLKKSWLQTFESHLRKSGLSQNTIAHHLTNLRAVVNFAISEEITGTYGFRSFKIKRQETRKRSLSVEQLRKFLSADCEDWQRQYQDMFRLMFLLIGINGADLFRARWDDVCDGRLLYRRSKTGRLFSIKLEPEALEIINRYAGSDLLLKTCEHYSNHADYLHRMNRGLRTIGEMKRVGRGGKKVRTPMFPDLTSYWARHTWATIARSIGVSVDDIAYALGHSDGHKTTHIYLKEDLAAIDNANRRVIDWVIYEKK